MIWMSEERESREPSALQAQGRKKGGKVWCNVVSSVCTLLIETVEERFITRPCT